MCKQTTPALSYNFWCKWLVMMMVAPDHHFGRRSVFCSCIIHGYLHGAYIIAEIDTVSFALSVSTVVDTIVAISLEKPT